MNAFHIGLHRITAAVATGPQATIAGREFSTLTVPQPTPQEALGVGFDDAVARLARHDGLFIELDGSFVWVGRTDGFTWQLDGILYDRNEEIVYVELKGECPECAFEELCRTLGLSPGQTMVQLMQQAVFMDWAEFRRFAFAS